MIFRQNTKDLTLRLYSAKKKVNAEKKEKARNLEYLLGELSIAINILNRVKKTHSQEKHLVKIDEKIEFLKKKIMDLDESINP